MGTIRKPIKKTSIEKKKRIIEKGFELMCNKGYHNVSCVDIAKYAGVSTGLIYQYFTDKKDIFLEGVKDYSNKIMFPMINILDNKEISFDIEKELGVEIVGETKVKIAIEEDEEPWDEIDDDVTEEDLEEINKVDENYIQ